MFWFKFYSGASKIIDKLLNMKNQAAKSAIRTNQSNAVNNKIGRTISNLNSPRAKASQAKEYGMPKSPPSTNIKIANTKIQRTQQINESDTSTQDPIIKSANTLVSPSKKQIPSQPSTLSSKHIQKPDYSKKQSRLGSPRNNLNAKVTNKKNPQENSAVPVQCKNCEELKAKFAENQQKLDELQKKMEANLEEKNNQILNLEAERKTLKEKMAVYEEIVKKNKKLIKEQVSEFHGSGKQKEQNVNRIRELEEKVKVLQKQKQERDLERQKSAIENRHEIKFANMIEVESEFVSNPPLGISEFDGAHLKQQSKIQDNNFNQSSIYRMIHSKNTPTYENDDNKAQVQKIKKQFEGSLGQICEQFEEKVKNLENEVNRKYEEIITLKEQVIVGKKEKQEFQEKLKEVSASAERLRRQNSVLRSKISDYEDSKIKNVDCTESTLQSSEWSMQEKRNLLKELCQQRRRNNRNCLNKLERMKSIQQQQCAIINNFQNTSRIMFSEIQEFVQQ